MLRPSPARVKKLSEIRMGYSNAAKRRKAKQMSRLKRNKNVVLEKYVIVDVETTGLSVVEDEIIEIGAILVYKQQIESKYHFLIKSNRKISQKIGELTKLTYDILNREGRELQEVLPEFLEFVGDYPVVSHNSEFDYGFLRSACKQCNLPLFSNKCVDTLTLARRLITDARNYKLGTLLEYFGIASKGKHRSLEDCISTMHLYEKLIDLCQKEE